MANINCACGESDKWNVQLVDVPKHEHCRADSGVHIECSDCQREFDLVFDSYRGYSFAPTAKVDQLRVEESYPGSGVEEEQK